MPQEFNAQNFPPQQPSGSGHLPGIFAGKITNTYGKSTKDGSGGMFIVELTSDGGKIDFRLNLWNQSPQAVEIANKHLSGLCHAVGIFRLQFPDNADGTPNLAMYGAALRGAQLRYEVGKQDNTEYMEVKRFFDVNGNEPGKGAGTAGAQQPQGQQGGNWGAATPPQQQPSNPPQNAAPLQQQPNGAWGGAAPAQAPQGGNAGWTQPSQPQQPQQPQGNPADRPAWAK